MLRSHCFVAQERDRLRHVTGNVASEERQFVTSTGNLDDGDNGAALRGEHASIGSLGCWPDAESPTEIINLSAFVQDIGRVHCRTSNGEEALARLPAVSAIRSDPSADAMLLAASRPWTKRGCLLVGAAAVGGAQPATTPASSASPFIDGDRRRTAAPGTGAAAGARDLLCASGQGYQPCGLGLNGLNTQ